MKKENLKEAIFLKGKESFIVGLLLILLGIVLIIPIVSVLVLRFVFKLAFKAKEGMQEEVAVSKILTK